MLGYFNVGDETNVSIYFQATIPDESMAISEGIVEGFRVNLCQTVSIQECPGQIGKRVLSTTTVCNGGDRKVHCYGKIHVHGPYLQQLTEMLAFLLTITWRYLAMR